MLAVMFDTNIYNSILDGKVDIGPLVVQIECFVTHVQYDELQNTRNLERKAALLRTFKEINQQDVPTEAGVWDVSRWDDCKWSDKNGLYDTIKRQLDKLNRGKGSNIQDALIAETAVKNGFILVTHDADLYSVVTRNNGRCLNLPCLVALIGADATT